MRPDDLTGAALTYVEDSVSRMQPKHPFIGLGGRPPNPEPAQQPLNPIIHNRPLLGAINALEETKSALMAVEIKRRRGLSECDMDMIRAAKREARALEAVKKYQVQAINKLRKGLR